MGGVDAIMAFWKWGISMFSVNLPVHSGSMLPSPTNPCRASVRRRHRVVERRYLIIPVAPIHLILAILLEMDRAVRHPHAEQPRVQKPAILFCADLIGVKLYSSTILQQKYCTTSCMAAD